MGPLIEHLSSHKYPSIALDLPTGSAPDKDLYDDTRYITSHLDEFVSQQGNEVIMVLHSYGGIPGSSAARSFVKKERAERGKEGGVIGVVYISAWALPAGKTVMDAMEGLDFDWAKIDVRVHASSEFRSSKERN
jgi:pimeloyl-ACP methyl ester carboxylesterase